MSNTSVVTGEVRLSYLNVFEPKSIDGKSEPKYSASIIIQKKDKATLKAIEAAVDAAIEIGISKKWGGKRPKKLKLPLRDGDEDREENDEYAGAMFLNASSKQQPGLVDTKVQRIIDPFALKSGDFGRVALSFFPYEFSGAYGVGVSLDHIQKIKDGEALGGTRASVESVFTAVDTDDDDIF